MEVERTDTGEPEELTCRWLFCAAGYYRYDAGFTPQFPGVERLAGEVVHPQSWPEDLDVTGKRVVVIGSGATAVALVPALARTAEHVTMLQRSPSYVLPLPARDEVGDALRRWLGPELGHRLSRRKNIARQKLIYGFCRRHPRAARRWIRRIQERLLPEGFDIDRHFTPRYDPWDQRLCAAPGGDLFRALGSGRAGIVTDRIAGLDESGVQLESGTHLDADLVVTATGLQLLAFGGIELVVDGRPVSWPDTLSYKAMLLSGVPNFAYAIGYTNSSWTLKVDLVAEHLCRLLAEMDARGADTCLAEPPEGMVTRPLLDLAAGYVLRSVDQLPRQGVEQPWSLDMDYARDVALLRRVPSPTPLCTCAAARTRQAPSRRRRRRDLRALRRRRPGPACATARSTRRRGPPTGWARRTTAERPAASAPGSRAPRRSRRAPDRASPATGSPRSRAPRSPTPSRCRRCWPPELGGPGGGSAGCRGRRCSRPAAA